MTMTTRNALLILCLSGCVDLDAQRDVRSDDNHSITNAGAEALDDSDDQRGFDELPVEIPTDASVAWLISGDAAPSIPAMPLVQSSAEPTSIAIDLTPPPVTYGPHIVDDYVRVPHPTWNLRVIDDASGEVVCHGSTSLACTIPGLAAGAAPRELTVYAVAVDMPLLDDATATFGPATFTLQAEDGAPLTYTSESMTWVTPARASG
jgi:hypothetical protein